MCRDGRTVNQAFDSFNVAFSSANIEEVKISDNKLFFFFEQVVRAKYFWPKYIACIQTLYKNQSELQ